MDSFEDVFNRALKNNHNTVLFCNCSVNYDGRAKSFLADGDRIILIKKDKTILIHQPNGSNPINYMKEGATHKLLAEKSSYILKSSNAKEFLTIKINELYHIHSMNLEDSERLLLQGSERDMAEMIMQTPKLIDEHFKPISREEQTKYGYIDVMGHDKDGALIIIECKRYSADLKAVSQLRRYVEKIKSAKGIDNVKGIIASPSITSNALQMLKDFGFTHKTIKPPSYLEQYDKNQKNLVNFC